MVGSGGSNVRTGDSPIKPVEVETERPMDQQVMDDIYTELRSIAERHLRNERADHTLQPTALANEAFLKLSGSKKVPWDDRNRFLAMPAKAIRRILVDHARGKRRQKRGGEWQRIPLEAADAGANVNETDLIALDEAMTELARLNERHARLVELRFFGGLTMPEIAEVLGVSLRTVEGEWTMARRWLKSRLTEGDGA